MLLTRILHGVIERPVDEVRAQFADMEYHVARNVHPDIRLTIHSAQGATCAFRREMSLAGMKQTDEVVNTQLPDGSLQSDLVAGMNKGGRLLIAFSPEGSNATRLHATLTIPLSGMKALIAPLLGAAARKALTKAFLQDKHDLEAGNYDHYSRTATA